MDWDTDSHMFNSDMWRQKHTHAWTKTHVHVHVHKHTTLKLDRHRLAWTQDTCTDKQACKNAQRHKDIHAFRHIQRFKHTLTGTHTHTHRVAASTVINMSAQLIKWFPWGAAGASLKPCWCAPSAAEHSHRALELAAPWRMTGGNNCFNCRMWPDSHVWPFCWAIWEQRGSETAEWWAECWIHFSFFTVRDVEGVLHVNLCVILMHNRNLLLKYFCH